LRALIFLLAVIVIYLFLRWLFRQPAGVRFQFTAVIVAVGLLLLAATGRLHWLAAFFAALLLFARRLLGLIGFLPLIQRVANQYKAARSAGGPTPGQHSNVESAFLRMSLNHETGEIVGEVLQGRFSGKQLAEMTLDELLELYEECRNVDEESAALLQAYLERAHGDDWREHVEAHRGGASQPPTDSSQMTRKEAFEILGLMPQATHEDIIEAHRRLMQKLHPDRGGSTYLAAKINQAKEVLLSH
jgi:hypothetical protein